MLETIRIRRAGYPVRVPFDLFVFRYRALLQGKIGNVSDTKATCLAILGILPPDEREGWQLGVTKVSHFYFIFYFLLVLFYI